VRVESTKGTELGERGLQKAALKFIAADPGNAELRLSRLMRAAKLSHRQLIQLFQMGCCQLGTTELLYVVMEYADENLSQILPHRPVSGESIQKPGLVAHALQE
jgi:hypothetical protein